VGSLAWTSAFWLLEIAILPRLAERHSMLENHSDSRVLALSPGFGDVLSAVGELGQLFLVVRNEGCLLGGLTEELSYSQIGRRTMVWAKDFNLNLSSRRCPAVLAYSESGVEGEIAGIEFFDHRGRGCLKICRTSDVYAEDWDDLVSSLTRGVVNREALGSLRKTNHLNSGPCCESCRQQRAQWLDTRPPVENTREILCDFIQQAIHENRRLDIQLPCGLLRAQASLSPMALNWLGKWAFVSSENSGCHLRVAEGSEVTVSEKAAGIYTMNLFDDWGRFAARVTSRPNTNTYL